MLKLLIFVPCEKVIIGEKGQPSLIGVLELITLKASPELSPEALSPFRWGFLTLWRRTESIDKPIVYESEIRLMRPDGTQALKVNTEFSVTDEHENYRQDAGDISVFPTGQDGTCYLELFLRKKGDEEWEPITKYPILVKHIKETAHEQKSA
jgi:hypothetical protein